MQKLAPGQSRKSTKGTNGNGVAKPGALAKELEKALNSAVVHLSTSNTAAVKVATAAMSPAQSTANIQAVVESITSKLLPQGWRNVRAIHVKGPNTPAFPIWLASELWVKEEDVLEERKVPGQKRKRENAEKKARNREQASKAESGGPATVEAASTAASEQDGRRVKKKVKSERRIMKDGAGAEHKSMLKKQKTAILADADAT